MLNLTKLETVEIPLNKLTLWDDNVRTNGAEEGLDELIASITSVGLLRSLVVQKATRGQYSVIAGNAASWRSRKWSHLATSNAPCPFHAESPLRTPTSPKSASLKMLSDWKCARFRNWKLGSK